MPWSKHIAIAGFCATAIAFGPARMGFGLFLPDLRDTFEVSTTLAGIIASTGFLAFLVALPLARYLVSRTSPRVPVIAGTLSAAVGFLLVATAQSPWQLLVGIAFASASAGLCWAPFNDAAERIVALRAQPGVLAVIASGTSIGVMLAAVLAFAVSYDIVSWRQAWVGFAIAAGLTVLTALIEMPPHSRYAPQEAKADYRRLLRTDAVPLYAAALCFGATNAVYFSFAADRVVGTGGLPGLKPGAAAGIIFLSYGAFGLLGVFSGKVEARTGIGPLLRGILAAAAVSHLLVAIAPDSWAGVLTSAGLQGAALMSVSALISIWSLRLFPGMATSGFVAALVALALGSMIGPAAAGYLSDQIGAPIMFTLMTLPLLSVALWPAGLKTPASCNPA